MENVTQLPFFVYMYFLYIQPSMKCNVMVDPGLSLELKSDLGLEKVGVSHSY